MIVESMEKVGKGDRWRVKVDGQTFVIEAEILARHSLKTGDEMSEQAWESLVCENANYCAFNSALALVGRSCKTQKQVEQYLAGKGFDEKAIAPAIEKLKEYNYIDERAYAMAYIRDNAKKSGRRKIEFELKNRGVSKEIIDEALDSLESGDEHSACMSMAEKKVKSLPLDDPKTRQKLYSYLASRGFGYDEISSVVGELCNDWY